MPAIIMHLPNEDPVLGEIDELPKSTDTILALRHPRKRDGKDVPYLEPNVTLVYWPISRITFIEVLPGVDEEEIVSFARE